MQLVRKVIRRFFPGKKKGKPSYKSLIRDISKAKLSSKQQIAIQERLAATEMLGLPGAELKFSISSVTEFGRVKKVKETWTADWVRNLSQGAVLWDVGANIGIFSMLAAQNENVVKVVAIEPFFLNHAAILKNAMLNNLNGKVIALPIGLGETSSVTSFNLQNVVPGGALHSFGEIVKVSEERSTEPVGSYSCFCFRLDDLVGFNGVPFPTHIKMDIDGFEMHALRGAEKTLRDPRLKGMQVEVIDYEDSLPRRAELVALVESAGLSLIQVIDHGSAMPHVADLQFARPSDHSTSP